MKDWLKSGLIYGGISFFISLIIVFIIIFIDSFQTLSQGEFSIVKNFLYSFNLFIPFILVNFILSFIIGLIVNLALKYEYFNAKKRFIVIFTVLFSICLGVVGVILSVLTIIFAGLGGTSYSEYLLYVGIYLIIFFLLGLLFYFLILVILLGIFEIFNRLVNI
jgi:hypothetical protein